MMVSNFNRNLMRNLSDLDNYYAKLSTGKQIRVPSDDPVGATRAMGMRTNLQNLEQYLKNIDDAVDWMNATETALESVTQLSHRIRELTVYGANSSLSDSDMKTIGYEIHESLTEFISIANMTDGERYLFGGRRTTLPPFEETNPEGEIQYVGSQQLRETTINHGQCITVGLKGSSIFMDEDEGLSIFDVITDIEEALMAGDSEALSKVHLARVDDFIDCILENRARNGAQLQQLEIAKTRMDDMKYFSTELLSKMEDVNIAEVITDLKMSESVYTASLAVGARIMRPTLVDFLT